MFCPIKKNNNNTNIGDVFPQTFHKFIDIQSFPVTQILIAYSCNILILTGLWINRLQVIILFTSTLLQVWLLLESSLECFFFQLRKYK